MNDRYIAVAKTLLRKYFHVRRSAFALQSPSRKAPGPIYCTNDNANELLDRAINSHLTGSVETFDDWHGKKHPTSSKWRLGGYTLNEESHVRSVCIDVDGGSGHAMSIAEVDPVILFLYVWCQEHGFFPYMERSGSAEGWHLWLFFGELVPAIIAKRFGHWIAKQVPHDLLLLTEPYRRPNGVVVTHATLEVFPKQTTATTTGNMVYDPWWSGAATGGSQFYTPDMELLSPEAIGDFKHTVIPTTHDIIDDIERQAPVPPPREYATRTSGSSSRSGGKIDNDKFQKWKKEMQDAIDLNAVYGRWLTGNHKNGGWLECRDPNSPTGDRNPSAGVYHERDGQYPRGRFHSFINGENSDIIQFTMDVGMASGFAEACRMLAEMSGTEDSCPFVKTNAPVQDNTTVEAPVPPQMKGERKTEDKTPMEMTKEDILPPGVSRMPFEERKPRIVVTGQGDDEIVAKAVDVLVSRNMKYFQLFRKEQGDDATRVLVWNGRKLIDINNDKHGEILMSLLLMSSIEWVRITPAQERVTDRPPYRLNFAILERLKPKLPEIEYIVNRPCFMQDGKVCLKRGYHAKNKVYNEGDFSDFNIPLKPTKKQVQKSLAVLDAIYADFPFRTQRDKNFYLVALMQQFVRLMMISPTPMFVFTALGPGAGKSLLARVIQSVSGGKAARLTAFAPGQEAEFEKQTVSIFRTDVDSVLIDNVKDVLDSAYLEGVITSFKVTGRLLGVSQMLEFTNSCIWLMTSNKARLSSDLARRSLRIELKSKGGTYRIKNLDKFVDLNKKRIREAIMTIIQYWVAGGARTPSNKPLLESFESWSEIMAGIMMSIGRKRFCEDVQAVIASHDPVDEYMEMMIPTWQSSFGRNPTQAREIFSALDSSGVLLDMPYNRSVSSFAKWLRQISEQKSVRGHVLKSTKNKSTGVNEYQLIPAPAPERSIARSLVETTEDESVSLLHDDIKAMNDRLLDEMIVGYEDDFLE
jgi:hypothetical protein